MTIDTVVTQMNKLRKKLYNVYFVVAWGQGLKLIMEKATRDGMNGQGKLCKPCCSLFPLLRTRTLYITPCDTRCFVPLAYIVIGCSHVIHLLASLSISHDLVHNTCHNNRGVFRRSEWRTLWNF